LRVEIVEKESSDEMLTRPDQRTIEVRADGEPIAEINIWPEGDEVVIAGSQLREIRWEVPK
jgi:hypothetical protein